MSLKRGLNNAEARRYVGVRRRTFDQEWRPRLNPIRQGTSLIFDRAELDALFDEFKRGDLPKLGASEAASENWPLKKKGGKKWEKEHQASTLTETAPGKLISNGGAIDFAAAASLVMKKRKTG